MVFIKYFLAFSLIGILGFLLGSLSVKNISCVASELRGHSGERKAAMCSCFHRPSKYEGVLLVMCEIKEFGK